MDDGKVMVVFLVAVAVTACFGMAKGCAYGLEIEKAHIAAGHCEKLVGNSKVWVPCDGEAK